MFPYNGSESGRGLLSPRWVLHLFRTRNPKKSKQGGGKKKETHESTNSVKTDKSVICPYIRARLLWGFKWSAGNNHEPGGLVCQRQYRCGGLGPFPSRTRRFNTGVGVMSLNGLVDGAYNTAVGAGALFANKGDNNTATGASALLSNTFGAD